MMMVSALLFTALGHIQQIERWQVFLMVLHPDRVLNYAFDASEEGARQRPGDMAKNSSRNSRKRRRRRWLAVLSIVSGVSRRRRRKFLVIAGLFHRPFLGVSDTVIELAIVAVDLAAGTGDGCRRHLQRHADVSVRNVIGAGMYNLLAIVGLVSAVAPVPVPDRISSLRPVADARA